MSIVSKVTFYLYSKLCKQAIEGNHNFIVLIGKVLIDARLTVAFDSDDIFVWLCALVRLGCGIFLMDLLANDCSFILCQTYIILFWHIEK